MKIRNKIALLITGLAFTLTGCDDFLEAYPTGEMTDAQVITDIAGLQAQLNGTYRLLRDGVDSPSLYSPQGMMALSSMTGIDLMTNDEQAANYLYRFSEFQLQRYEPAQEVPTKMWNVMYKIISNANIVLMNIDDVSGDEARKNAIKGQALIIRSRCYFNLVRFYQHTYVIAKNKPGVPIYLTTTLEGEARSTVEAVYARIVDDLTEAETLLKDYQRPSKDFYNKDVAQFLLANVYLTMGNWAQGQAYANKIRTSYPLMTIAQYSDGFSTANDEWVAGYIQTSQDYWWYDSPACWYSFGHNNAPWEAELIMPVKHFVEEVMLNDPRNLTIANPLKTGYYAATKFRELKNSGPYGDLFDMRAAEMYLVEAECAARNDDLTTAKTVLNTLQTTRGAAVTSATTKNELIDAILLERRKEMWGEGLDYFDVMRLQLPISKKMSQGFFFNIDIPANSNKLIMMIPEKETINNPLMEQNPHPDKEPVFQP